MFPTLNRDGTWTYNGVTYRTSAEAIAAKRKAEYEQGGVVAAAKRPTRRTAPKKSGRIKEAW